jgi:hypothetical protein
MSKVLELLNEQQISVTTFFEKTKNTGIKEVYTNFDEAGLYLVKEDAIKNSGAGEFEVKAVITWIRN